MNQGTRNARLAAAAVLGALGLGVAAPAHAECYDVVGCTDANNFARHYRYLASEDGPSCDDLYRMRNQIYAEHGYCFVTPRGIDEIGNDGCYIHNQARVRLSYVERNNVAVIQRAEREKDCPS
jgi:hypothetical protein